MEEIYTPQPEQSDETNPILTGISVGLGILDASLKVAEVAVDELSGNDEEYTDDYHPVSLPHQLEQQKREYDQWLVKQEETENQQLATVRSELASVTPLQHESASSTIIEPIPVSVPQAPIDIAA